MDLRNKRVLVFGAGISGIGAVVLLQKVQALPVLYDANEKLKKEELLAKLPAGSEPEILLGQLSDKAVESLDLCVLSPGVPTDLPLVERIRRAGVPIWGEIELAFANGKGQVMAITGTNGKTTTTSLLGDIMRYHQELVYVVGNIGVPYTDIALDTTENTVTVAEISSFQLETAEAFHPYISAILNITPDHLDRHHTMEEYIRVKESITKNQGERDTCVLNYEDEILRGFGKSLKTKVLFFSSLRTLEKGIYLKDSMIIYDNGAAQETVCSVKELRIPGRHNYENVMAAVGMALAAGVPMEEIRHVVKRFTAVEHRIEFVEEKQGVIYYNDSKGTNPDAAIKAIQAMECPTLLIGGGYDKGSSYEEWIHSFGGKVKCLVLLGATKAAIAKTARECGFHNIIFADTLEEAVQICAEKAVSGDAVLLSPACASWDMFPSYEVRGRMFKEYVKRI